MFKAIWVKRKRWLKGRQLARFRREFGRCGYPVEHLDDSRIEAALTGNGAHRIEEVPLSAKTIYFALRRLYSDGGENVFRERRTFRALQIKET